ncbi:FeoB-associated Cys-rich membrane protein [Desulfolithobacter dissulfuricans]|uniref:FeoB-associated Cys-rich membrane protein n=1 Tax=Desulfolithobacter dissulfuricans TaxID=2795293 RepID=UPI00338DA339
MQNSIVFIIVVVIALGFIIRLYRRLVSKTVSGCGWGCSHCSSDSGSCSFKPPEPDDTTEEKP